VWESLVVNSGVRPSFLLGEEFLSAPIHFPPSLVTYSVIQLVLELITDLHDSKQSQIQRWHTRNGVRVLHTLMVRTTICGKGGWPLSS
jgi:hypothetical protein